ncbi:MAG: prolipoprotein diacylglyceryl transferase [Patescibacteria group bacterium]|jgi:phosphatidylglycerol:prolipoprotein diacylglycerol transferase
MATRPSPLPLQVAGLLAGLGVFVFLQAVFSGALVLNPVAVSVGPLHVRWYGLLIALAIAVGIPWTIRRAAVRGIASTTAETILWWAVLGGVVGARLIFVLQNLAYYGEAPSQVFALTDGGLSIHGALLGGFLVGALVTLILNRSARSPVHFWSLADAAVPALLLGMVVGRFGNLFNYELYGPPARVLWRMFVPTYARPELYADYRYFHPTFLYEAVGNVLVLAFILMNERRATHRGELVLWFFFGSSLVRFLVEFWRLGSPVVGVLTSAQLVSLVLAFSALALALLRRRPATR